MSDQTSNKLTIKSKKSLTKLRGNSDSKNKKKIKKKKNNNNGQVNKKCVRLSMGDNCD